MQGRKQQALPWWLWPFGRDKQRELKIKEIQTKNQNIMKLEGELKEYALEGLLGKITFDLRSPGSEQSPPVRHAIEPCKWREW